MPARSQTLRLAAIQRRRMAIVEAAFIPKITAELVRVAKEAASVYGMGGIAAVKELQVQHIENMAAILQEMYTACTKTEQRRLFDLYKKLPVVIEKKDEAEDRLLAIWLSESFEKSKFISETTFDNLLKVTQRGLLEGLNEEGMAKLIQETQEGLATWRAKTIARTETHRAIMQSQHEITKSMDLPPHAREWVSAGVRARDAHRDVDGQKRLPDTPFDVGGEKLMYPGQRGGDPANFVNCRCVVSESFEPEDIAEAQ